MSSRSPEAQPGMGLADCFPFPIGVAADLTKIQKVISYKNILEADFNSITPEYHLKPEFLWPAKDDFYWENADALIDYCGAFGKRVHGHTLVWHEALPAWLKDLNADKNEFSKLFESYITMVTQHFKGKITGWDVVNEAFGEDGGISETFWWQHTGENYIEKAFDLAHNADPNALLFYNDYSLEINAVKRNAVITYLNNLRNKGLSIHGIGLQMHLNVWNFDVEQFEKAITEIVQCGYLVHLSEIDLSVINQNNQDHSVEAKLEKQAGVLESLTEIYKQVPAAQQYGMTFWGISDKDSWLCANGNKNEMPLLFDNDYEPKPAYHRFKNYLKYI